MSALRSLWTGGVQGPGTRLRAPDGVQGQSLNTIRTLFYTGTLYIELHNAPTIQDRRYLETIENQLADSITSRFHLFFWRTDRPIFIDFFMDWNIKNILTIFTDLTKKRNFSINTEDWHLCSLLDRSYNKSFDLRIFRGQYKSKRYFLPPHQWSWSAPIISPWSFSPAPFTAGTLITICRIHDAPSISSSILPSMYL